VDLVLAGASVCTLSQFLASDGPPTRVPPEEGAAHLLDAIVASDPGRPTKRARDLVLASLGLLVSLPLLPLIAAAIRFESKGPIIFAQERLGQFRRPFRCLKFRTMCVDAERATGPAWAAADDPRITRVGRFLRRSRLDELPQLVNVIRGEMSLVGTRPIRRHFADQLVALLPLYDLRFLEPPGLTGWAQVEHRYSSSFSDQIEKFSYDYYYIRNQSFWLDLYIMLRTVAVMARMKGL
jgi:lipopolysaccharide/colanic/teichoic acid biosynthesis glycosyltransferase